MPTESTFLLAGLFLLLAAAGWALGRFGESDDEDAPPPLNIDYLKGLNFLLNEQTDQALEHFLEMVRVDDKTIETHFALGSLFRRRGEVDRAIRIHQNLIARPTLNKMQRSAALLELGQDYCTDATNSLSNFSRNFLRNEVIPKIKERFGPTFESGILSLGRQATENQMLLDQLCASFASAIQTTADRIVVDCMAFADQSPVLVRHALVSAWGQQGWPRQNMTHAHWSRLGDFVCGTVDSSPFMLPGNIRVESVGNSVVISR